jgi:hypothetical protein
MKIHKFQITSDDDEMTNEQIAKLETVTVNLLNCVHVTDNDFFAANYSAYHIYEDVENEIIYFVSKDNPLERKINRAAVAQLLYFADYIKEILSSDDEDCSDDTCDAIDTQLQATNAFFDMMQDSFTIEDDFENVVKDLSSATAVFCKEVNELVFTDKA